MVTDAARSLRGIGASPGSVVGPALVVVRESVDAALDASAVELDALLAAVESVGAELEARAAASGGDAADILATLALMVRDPSLLDSAAAAHGRGEPPALAYGAALEEHRAALRLAGGYLAERVEDLVDLERRVLATALGRPLGALPDPGYPHVLVVADLAPADTVALNPDHVMAIVSEQGGRTSHTSVVARSLGIPAVVACAGALAIPLGASLLVDGDAGTVVLEPSREEVARVRAQRAPRPRRDGPCSTSDGVRVELLANVSGGADAQRAAALGAEGVGLLRTELVFLDRATAPSRDEQEELYEAVFSAFPGRRVVVRSLDAGADKPLPFLTAGREENPALGQRGVRLYDANPAVLDDQLAAIASAAARTDAEVSVMAPMVATPAEAHAFALRARAAGLGSVGSMVEVPAAALRAGDLLAHCDFLCIGTNDLGQYCFAADRSLAALADLLDPWQPALLDLVRLAVAAGERLGKPVSICGEAASEPLLAPVLVGLGVRTLSMSAGSIAGVHESIARRTTAECEKCARLALAAGDAREAREAVEELIRLADG